MKEIKITENEAGQRLDRFLLKYFNNSSRANVFKLIRKKVFKVNGAREGEAYFLNLGDVISVYLSDEAFDALIKEEKEWKSDYVDLDIVHEDDEILIVNKPKGLLTHPDKSEYKETLSTRVQLYLKPLCTRTFKPASIQRLDKNTSGLVLFCKTYDSLKKYNELMRQRKIQKFYMAIVEGRITEEGEVAVKMSKDEVINKSSVVDSGMNDDDDGKDTLTRYKPLKRFGRYTLIEVELLTGRTHQIRVAMSSIGHPLAGDVKYGGKRLRELNGQLLHGYKLIVEGNTYTVESEEIKEFLLEQGQ